MAYCTVGEVLQRIGHSGATSGDLTIKINDAINAATATIEADTGRVFTSATATKVLGASDPYVLHVPDLTAVTTLKVDDNDDGTFETTIAASGYELDSYSTRDGWPYDTIRLLDRSWPCGGKRRRRIEVVGTFGWAAVPAPINQACSLLAARVAQRPSTALYGVQSFNDAGAAMIKARDSDYLHLIGPYVIPQVA